MAELPAESGGVHEFNKLIAANNQQDDAGGPRKHEEEQLITVSLAIYHHFSLYSGLALRLTFQDSQDKDNPPGNK